MKHCCNLVIYINTIAQSHNACIAGAGEIILAPNVRVGSGRKEARMECDLICSGLHIRTTANTPVTKGDNVCRGVYGGGDRAQYR